MSVKLFRDDPSLFKTSVAPSLKVIRAIAFFFFFYLFSTQSVLGANGVSQERLSAVMTIVHVLLLQEEDPIPEPEGDRVDIGLAQLLPDTFIVSDATYAAF